MNSIQIIFVDIDGTLVYRHPEQGDVIAPENIEMIQKVKEKGIKVIITTGRASSVAIPVAKSTGCDDEYMISYNGGMITKNGEIIVKNCLSDSFISEISKMIIENKLYSQFYQGEQCYIVERTSDTQIYENIAKFYPIVIGEEMYQMKEMQRITIVAKDETMKMKVLEFLKKYEDVEVYIFWNDWIEITSKSATKGNAVNQVCKILEIDPKNAMAIGDDKIDVSMWNVVGYPVVMGQAKDHFKEGRIVTDTVENAGVAKVLEKYCF